MTVKKIKIVAAAIISLAAISLFHPSLRAQQTAETPRSVWDGVYNEEQAKRGAALYAQECASCHGAEMTGGEEAPPLAGGAFLANWDGLTVGDLTERTRISMPPNTPRRLNRQQVVDILSHLLRLNNFPAGKAELEAKIEVLKQIQIQASKPLGKSDSGSASR
jgi:mono/diheme cytochrome c family protein